jgi:Family of unknown function (DUF6506)
MTVRKAIIDADAAGNRLEFGSTSETTTILAAPDEAAAAQIAGRLVDEGVEEIQLCGATGPMWAAEVMQAVEGKARVGTVLYGFESMTSIAEFKDRFEAGEHLNEAFILRCSGADPATDRLVEGRRTYVAVPDDGAAVKAAAELDDKPEGIHLIELYGGFHPSGTAKVIAATGGGRVPVGAVYYSS